MDISSFAARLSELRMQKGVSARDMSLSIGQSAGYINNIENGINLPSMSAFFYICEYLGITPSDFFEADKHNPSKLIQLMESAKRLPDNQLDLLLQIIDQLK